MPCTFERKSDKVRTATTYQNRTKITGTRILKMANRWAYLISRTLRQKYVARNYFSKQTFFNLILKVHIFNDNNVFKCQIVNVKRKNKSVSIKKRKYIIF